MVEAERLVCEAVTLAGATDDINFRGDALMALAEVLCLARVVWTSDGPGRDRTCDLGIKSPLLYQLSYRPCGAM